MNRLLVLGGSGVLGSAVVDQLGKTPIDFLIGSRQPIKSDAYAPVNRRTDLPWTRVDLLSGEGLAQALVGVDTVLHLASAPGNLGREAKELVMTRNLLRAVKRSGVKQLIYSSIVGIDRVPYRYYQAKLSSERLIGASSIPYTILRATQFHELVDFALSKLFHYPIGFIPKKFLLQPLPASTVAHELLRLTAVGGQRLIKNLGGPHVHEGTRLARLWLEHQCLDKPIVAIPSLGSAMRHISSGSLTCPESASMSQTWESYLFQKYGPKAY